MFRDVRWRLLIWDLRPSIKVVGSTKYCRYLCQSLEPMWEFLKSQLKASSSWWRREKKKTVRSVGASLSNAAVGKQAWAVYSNHRLRQGAILQRRMPGLAIEDSLQAVCEYVDDHEVFNPDTKRPGRPITPWSFSWSNDIFRLWKLREEIRQLV